MKCVAVSDIHMREVKTPDADLLLVAGDMTMTGSLPQMTWFENWLLKQPQKHKVWIAGNHEMGLEQNPLQAPRLAERTESIYLEDSGVDIDGISIWGSPVTPWFHDWAFNRQRGEEIRRHWQMIPEGTDILMVHGPPYGHLDYTIRGEHVGCNDLIEVLEYELE
jgi:Icc-related predicted phosphoesterase